MNVNIVRLAPLTAETKRLADAQERIAKCLEAICAFNGIRIAAILPEEEQGEEGLAYQTDEMTAVREAEDELRKMGYKAPEEPDVQS